MIHSFHVLPGFADLSPSWSTALCCWVGLDLFSFPLFPQGCCTDLHFFPLSFCSLFLWEIPSFLLFIWIHGAPLKIIVLPCCFDSSVLFFLLLACWVFFFHHLCNLKIIQPRFHFSFCPFLTDPLRAAACSPSQNRTSSSCAVIPSFLP